MAKAKSNSQRKKRNKKYSGKDAAVTDTQVTRISAPDRSKLGEWWHDNRQRVIFWSVSTATIVLLIYLITIIWRWLT